MAIDAKGLKAACEAYRNGGPVFEVSMRAAIRAYLKATETTQIAGLDEIERRLTQLAERARKIHDECDD